MPEHETLVQTVRSKGVKASSPTELIAVGFSRREEDANKASGMAREMLTRYPSLHYLAEISTKDMQDQTGLEPYEILRCQALMELGRKAAQTGKGDIKAIESAKDVFELLEHLRFERQEHFCSVLLDSKCQIIRTVTNHIGTVNMSVVGPREVFREAIREGSSAIIVAHNHPSGDPEPSPEDVEVTNTLVTIGKMLNIDVLDHVVIGANRFYSFAEKGRIQK